MAAPMDRQPQGRTHDMAQEAQVAHALEATAGDERAPGVAQPPGGRAWALPSCPRPRIHAFACAEARVALPLEPTLSQTFACRRGTPADAPILSALATQVFFDTYATRGIDADLAHEARTVYAIDVFERRLQDPAVELWMASAGGYAVGLLDLAFATSCPVAGVQGTEIFRLYVQRPFLRQGLGRTLVAAAESRALERQHDHLWLAAWAGNAPALAFYRAMGLRDVGTTSYEIQGQAYENRVLCKRLASPAIRNPLA